MNGCLKVLSPYALFLISIFNHVTLLFTVKVLPSKCLGNNGMPNTFLIVSYPPENLCMNIYIESALHALKSILSRSATVNQLHLSFPEQEAIKTRRKRRIMKR